MTNEELIGELLAVIGAGVEMRTAQAIYFKSRQSADLIASKNAEKAFDLVANRALSQHAHGTLTHPHLSRGSDLLP